MDLSNSEIEALVRKVLDDLNGSGSNKSQPSSFSGSIPNKAHVAYLTALEKFEVREVDMPAVGDDDILVKVEGCGICGTDAH